MAVEWELVTEGPAHRFVAIENVFISLYWGPTDAAALKARLPWAERCLESYGKFGQLVVVDRHAHWEMPSSEWREESARQRKRFESSVAFNAIVIEPTDTKAALIRTLARGLVLTMLLGSRIPYRVFDTVHPAADYCARHCEVPAAQILETCRQIRPERT